MQQANATIGFALTPDGGPGMVGEQRGNPEGDNNITVRDAATGDVIHEFGSSAIFVADVALSVDGSQVIAALMPHTVGIWETETGELLRQHTPIFSARIDVSPDGQMVISNSRGAHPTLWNFEDGEVIHTFDEVSGL